MRSTKITILMLVLIVGAALATSNSSTDSTWRLTPEPTEAPTGFDDKTNGFGSQQEFNEAMGAFNRHYFERDGLGPVFNAETCLRCHQFPTIGGFSLNTVTRIGRFDGKNFTPHPGGLVHQVAATKPHLKEQIADGYPIIVPRLSTSLLGSGFIEAIADDTIRSIALQQRRITNGKIAGEVIEVPVLESPGTKRVGRFGWKNSHASLVSFVGEAFLNEIGLTNKLFPIEITSGAKLLTDFDSVEEPEIDLDRIELVTRFVRATKAPARFDPLASSNRQEGERLFTSIGCSTCHIPSIRTLPAGVKINGGAFTIPEALGNKIIHPYSDFLLHDIGTGDGILEVGPPSTRNKIRTAPLWGLGTRVSYLGDHLVLLHDGSTKSLEGAILRHAGEAASVTEGYTKLTAKEKALVITFLNSL